MSDREDWPDDDIEQDAGQDAGADDDVLEELRALGWTGVPFVVHDGEVVGNKGLYQAAEELGIADRVPRVGLREVFREAGFDLDQFAEGYEPHEGEEVFAEDYLSELPRHIRDKYSI
ncbi:MAG TPA: hypothetical protein VFQ22_13930 [Longimicrobiales bacterium]|nr:hypothetical protein [Longimicrobiales bacterium]